MLQREDTTQKLTFKKGERLKSRKIIQSLFIQNQHIKIYPFKLVWLTEAENKPFSLKIGVSVSKRLFKSAVKRNLIKRKMRECVRLNKPLLKDKLNDKNIRLSFMLIYLSSDLMSYEEFDTKIKQLFIRLGEKVNN